MRILIGCEQFGVVREAFRRRGHQAWSCDLQPARDNSPFHIQDDILKHIHDDWDLAIFHPDCTFLTCSAEWAYGDGPYHQKVKPETLVGAARRLARAAAVEFVKLLLTAPIPRIAVENPKGHLSRAVGKPQQIIHPWQFGDDASKETHLWLKGLLPLRPTKLIAPRMVNGKPRWANQTDSGQNKLTPGPDRAMQRAATYPGIAEAMAEQWAGDAWDFIPERDGQYEFQQEMMKGSA